MQEAYHQVTAHILIRSIQSDFHRVTADGETACIHHFSHCAIVSECRQGGFCRLSHVNFEFGITPIDASVVGVEGQLVNDTPLHGFQIGSRNDELALGDVVNPRSINRYIRVGSCSVVHGNHVSVGWSEGHGVGPSALVNIVAISAHLGSVGLLRSKSFVGEWVLGHGDEVVLVAIDAELPFGFFAASCPAEGSLGAVTRDNGYCKTCRSRAGDRSGEGHALRVAGFFAANANHSGLISGVGSQT